MNTNFAIATLRIAELEAQLAQAHCEIARLGSINKITLNSELRMVSMQPELLDAEIYKPSPGALIFGLGLGGCLVPVVWNNTSCPRFFKGWMPYPKTPAALKRKINQGVYDRIEAQR